MPAQRMHKNIPRFHDAQRGPVMKIKCYKPYRFSKLFPLKVVAYYYNKDLIGP